jgi:putative ABC transport system substrate-binding protein
MRRREFIAALGGAAAWPVVARAQQTEPLRRIGALYPGIETSEIQSTNVAALMQTLRDLGWVEGRNLHIEARYSAGNQQLMQANAKEIVALKPEMILAVSGAGMLAAWAETRTIPIVFLAVNDPVGQGIVQSFSHPGGNATGFTNFDIGMGAKWVELLKQVAPGIHRIAVIFNPNTAPSTYSYLPIMQKAATLVGVKLVADPINDTAEIERAITMVGSEPDGGMIVAVDPFTLTHRARIVELASRYRVPAIYGGRPFVVGGGLISYGFETSLPELYRIGASYIDRILKGAKPADLPVQAPTKFELAINLKTSKALGLDIPPQLLAIADSVIE